MVDFLDADGLRRWCARSARELRRLSGEIDALNVFPVADADTGTNMALTMASAATAAHRAFASGADLPTVAAALSQAALLEARGNSGMILSQMLGGFAEGLVGRPAAGPAELARCLELAADCGYAAVAQPVEGTMLSVARAAALAAQQTAQPDGHPTQETSRVAFAAAQGAAHELARTPLRLAVLARAGVVDAGGRGLVAVLAALVWALTGRMPRLPVAPLVAMGGSAPVAVRESGSDCYQHEVCYLLTASRDALPRLRQRLTSLGDSVVIAGASRLWRVHVHVNDIEAAVEAGRRAGEVHRVTRSRLVEQAGGEPPRGRPGGDLPGQPGTLPAP